MKIISDEILLKKLRHAFPRGELERLNVLDKSVDPNSILGQRIDGFVNNINAKYLNDDQELASLALAYISTECLIRVIGIYLESIVSYYKASDYVISVVVDRLASSEIADSLKHAFTTDKEEAICMFLAWLLERDKSEILGIAKAQRLWCRPRT